MQSDEEILNELEGWFDDYDPYIYDEDNAGDELPEEDLEPDDEELGKADKPLKDPKGGLTAAGRKAFGGNLKPGVKNYSSASLANKKRWISWALRFYGQEKYPPLKKPNGDPTRFALTAAAWGEKVPTTEADARAIAAKARRRQKEVEGKGE